MTNEGQGVPSGFHALAEVDQKYEAVIRRALTVPRFPSQPTQHVQFFLSRHGKVLFPQGLVHRVRLLGLDPIYGPMSMSHTKPSKHFTMRRLLAHTRFVLECPAGKLSRHWIAKIALNDSSNRFRIVVTQNKDRAQEMAHAIKAMANRENIKGYIYCWTRGSDGIDFRRGKDLCTYPLGLKSPDVIVTTAQVAYYYVIDTSLNFQKPPAVIIAGSDSLHSSVMNALWGSTFGPVCGVVEPNPNLTEFDRMSRESLLGPTVATVNEDFGRYGTIRHVSYKLKANLKLPDRISLARRKEMIWRGGTWAKAVVRFVDHLVSGKTCSRYLAEVIKERFSIAVLVELERNAEQLRAVGLAEWTVITRSSKPRVSDRCIYTLGGADKHKIGADIVVLADNGSIEWERNLLAGKPKSKRRVVVDLLDQNSVAKRRLGPSLLSRVQFHRIDGCLPPDLPEAETIECWFEAQRSSDLLESMD